MKIYIPDGRNENDALASTTHLAVSAHEDDIEFMAYDGILRCRKSRGLSFTAAVLTDGAGSPRAGKYASFTDADMIRVRLEEQKNAARVGGYGALVMFDYPSSKIKDPADSDAVDALSGLFMRTHPDVIYTHNPADRHETHVAACLRAVEALRRVCGDGYMPSHLYGCEVWRDLDWLTDGDKVSFDVGGEPELESSLLASFDSQTAGGKRYDLAVVGRRLAHATFAESHHVDTSDRVIYAVDMMPLLRDKTLPVADFICEKISAFDREVRGTISKLM